MRGVRLANVRPVGRGPENFRGSVNFYIKYTKVLTLTQIVLMFTGTYSLFKVKYSRVIFPSVFISPSKEQGSVLVKLDKAVATEWFGSHSLFPQRRSPNICQ